MVAQHDERRCGTLRATRFRRVALFAGRPGGTGKKVKDREIDVAPRFCTGPCDSKAANHWQATIPPARPERRSPRMGAFTPYPKSGILDHIKKLPSVTKLPATDYCVTKETGNDK